MCPIELVFFTLLFKAKLTVDAHPPFIGIH